MDVTGWTVVVSSEAAGLQFGTVPSTTTQTLLGVMNPSEIKYWNDSQSSPNYWGVNLWFDWLNPDGGGWVMLLDANSNVVDFFFAGCDSTSNLSSTSINDTITYNGVDYPISLMWNGLLVLTNLIPKS